MKKTLLSKLRYLSYNRVMTVGQYAVRSISNYVREMRFIFEHYPDVEPAAITAEHIEQYI